MSLYEETLERARVAVGHARTALRNAEGNVRFEDVVGELNSASLNLLIAERFNIIVPEYQPNTPTITSIDEHNGSLTVNWSPGSQPKTITRVDYRVDSGDWINAQTTALSFLVPNLTNDQLYNIDIRVYNAIGVSDPSAPATGTPTALVPEAPTLTGLNRGDEQMEVEGILGNDGGSPITDIEYQLSGAQSTTWLSSGAINFPFIIGDLINGGEIHVRTRAVNANSTSPQSNELTETPGTVPDAMTLTDLDELNKVLRLHFVFGDDGGFPVTVIERSINGGTFSEFGGGITSPRGSQLPNGIEAGLRLRARNENGAGPPSNELFGIPNPDFPGFPTNIQVNAGTDNAFVTFTLGDDGNNSSQSLDNLQVYYRINGGSRVTLPNLDEEFNIDNLIGSTPYNLEMQQSNDAGDSDWSPIVNFTTEGSISIPTFPIPGPTITGASTGGGDVTLNYHIEDLSDPDVIYMPNVYYHEWRGDTLVNDLDAFGDWTKGLFNSAKTNGSSSGFNMLVNMGYPSVYLQGIFDRTDPPTQQEVENKAQQWATFLSSYSEQQVLGLVFVDEPRSGQGWTKQVLEDTITIIKNFVPSWVKVGYTITQGSVHGWSGTTQGWASNADFMYLDMYPWRLETGITSDSKSAFFSASNSWAFRRTLERMAEKMVVDGINPTNTTIRVNGQQFEGEETSNGWRRPPVDSALWFAEGINLFNDGTWTNNGFNIDLLSWWTWRDSTVNGYEEYPELHVAQKRVDVFNRSSASPDLVRINWTGSGGGSTTTSNMSQFTVNNLNVGSTHRFWVEARVNGEWSAISNVWSIQVQ